MFGLLNINKPATWTSRDVINWLSQQARRVKIGHAGTLDPLATGVLVVCVGYATRLVPYLHEQTKTYVATFLLGRRSASDDIDTDVEMIPDAPAVTTEQIRAVLPRFLGRITQLPPIYSAVKVNGARAYRKARKGKAVEVPEREIDVHRLELIAHAGDSFTLEIDCGSGTYVRSIGRDIALACGSGAVMSSLCRTRVGDFTLSDALAPQKVQRHTIQNQLLSPQRAVPNHRSILMTEAEAISARHGNEFPARAELNITESEVALVDSNGVLTALAAFDPHRQWLVPKVVMCSPPGKPKVIDPASSDAAQTGTEESMSGEPDVEQGIGPDALLRAEASSGPEAR